MLLYTFLFSFRDSITSYSDDKLYCWRKKTNIIGQCSKIPLIRISLFGVVIKHDNQCIALCGSCCKPMVFDVDRCSYNENGAMCSKCDETSESVEIIEQNRLKEMEQALRHCLFCGVELKGAASSFYYHENVYLCIRHNKKFLVKRIENMQNEMHTELNSEKTREMLLQWKQQDKINNISNKKARWRRELMKSKQNRNSKR